MQRENVVEILNVRTLFSGRSVHADVSFNIQRGQITALIAASGGGKSVLLREVLGLMRPKSGKIEVLGLDIISADQIKLNEIRNRFGILFQNGALFSGLTVAENIAVPFIEHCSLSKEEIAELVALKLALVGLSPGNASLYPSELSGGMRKRVALARALALDPELLFLDEPTSGLDPISAREFDSLVKVLSDSLNLSVFLITHDPQSLMAIADKVVCLADGTVVEQGSVREVMKSQHPWLKQYFSACSTDF